MKVLALRVALLLFVTMLLKPVIAFAAEKPASIHVDAARPVRRIDPRFFGVNLLYLFEDHAALADGRIEKALHDMPCRLMRFPGGAVSQNYLWKTNTPDDLHRWPFRSGPGLTDTDTFIALARRVGAEPIFVVNLDLGFIHHDMDRAVESAAQWVHYCNIEHHYNVKLWEIGNETYLYRGKKNEPQVTAEEYGRAFVKFARAMKRADPTVRIGALGPKAPHRLAKGAGGPAWWPMVLKEAGPEIDFVIIHDYEHVKTFSPGRPRPVQDFAYGEAHLLQYIRRTLGRNVPVALTEWNLGGNQELDAGETAIALTEIAGRHLEAGVDYACIWPLTFPKPTCRAVLDYSTHRAQPAWQVLHELSSQAGQTLLAAPTHAKALYVLATRSDPPDRITLFIVNKHAEHRAAPVRLAIDGFQATAATAQSFTTDPNDAARLQQRGVAVHRAGSEWKLRLPARSVTVVCLWRGAESKP